MSQDIVLRRLEVLEQEAEASKRYRKEVARRDALQFIATLVTIVVVLFGSARLLGWQNARLVDQMEKHFDDRITALEKRFDERITGVETRLNDRIMVLEKRLDQVEKRLDERITAVEQNLTARFEDLRQVILSQQQP